jgi:hypothetical protein
MVMLQRFSILCAGSLALLALTACGLTKSPAEGLNFKPPDGWQGTPGVMGRFQLWTANDKQMLMLLKLPADMKLTTSFDLNDFQDVNGPAALKDSKVLARRNMTMCGNQQSMFLKMQGKSTRQNTEETIEVVLSKAADGTFMAMYMRPLGSAADPAAEAAIYELCPAK